MFIDVLRRGAREVGTGAGNAGSEKLTMTGPTAGGVFTATITGPATPGETLAFVIMVETFTDDGATETQRKIAWRGTDFESYGEAGMVWTPLLTTAVTCDGDHACYNVKVTTPGTCVSPADCGRLHP